MKKALMVLLTEEQAAEARGATLPGHVLEPMPLTDGETWVLNACVLDDPHHAAKRPYLEELPRREVTAEEFAGREEQP